MKQKYFLFSLLSLTLMGCGGSQQNNTPYGSFDNRSKKSQKDDELSSTYLQPIFLTEIDPSPQKHFWVKLHRIDLESVQQKFPAFVSEKGVWFDFGSSATGITQKSLYIGDARADFIPEIVRATLTLGEKFLEQDSQGSIKKYSFALGKGQTQYRVSTTLNSEDRQKKNQPFALDFNLRSLVVHSDNKYSLEPRISFNTDYFTSEKQIPTLFQGEASEVMGSGASLGFLLREDNKALKVMADSQTKLFTHLGTVKDAQVKNRTDLQVWGEYQPSKNALVAQWIRLLPNHNIQNKTVALSGKVISVNHANHSLQVAPFRIQGFVPQKMLITVHLDKESVIIDSDGELTHENKLTENSWIHLEGNWNKNQTFHGQWIKFTHSEK